MSPYRPTSRAAWSPLFGGLCPPGCSVHEHVHRIGKDVGAGEQGVAQLRMMRTREDGTSYCGASSISVLVVYLRRWKSGLLSMRLSNPALRPDVWKGAWPRARGARKPTSNVMSPQDVPIDCVQQAEERLRALFAKEALSGRVPDFLATQLKPCPECRETYRRRRAKLGAAEEAEEQGLE